MSNDYKGLEIIHAGFHRTGTSSLSIALDILGYGPVWHSATTPDKYPKMAKKSFDWWVNNNIMKRLNDGEYIKFQDWLNIIQCRVVMDFPINFYWEQLYKQYPDTKVILSIRDFDRWYDSNCWLVDREYNSWKLKYFGVYLIPLWWIINYDYYGFHYHNNISRLLNPKNKSLVKQIYWDNYIENVKNKVKDGNLLIYNIKDGWDPLCKFLNVDVPKKEFPHINDKANVERIVSASERRAMKILYHKLKRICTFAVIICAFIVYFMYYSKIDNFVLICTFIIYNIVCIFVE